ncbi:class I SAM-dependent methyltransferase [Salaquimonas pukyongi]|uniref:class I SAM-dependent methyltransferase n=1 Tax=Salaquimonas pukyongi TaxID=2712698 RepID=UPI00096BC5BB|nr:class I SAM-dependent methyltransferase [Salaquimonas pukyongi]
MTDLEEHWEKAYEKGDSSVSWFQSTPEPSLGLILEHRAIAKRGVIDIGAGASALGDGLFEAGLSDITLLDISARALEIARRRLSEKGFVPKIVIHDITDWNPDRTWGVWHDRAVFHFLVREQDRTAYIERLDKATTKGSIVVIGTFALDGPERCSGLPVHRYSPETLQDALGAAYSLKKTCQHIHVTPAGREQRFQFSVFVRE